jgi:hypothetical protein
MDLEEVPSQHGRSVTCSMEGRKEDEGDGRKEGRKMKVTEGKKEGR